MTAKQKANQARFKKVVAEAKKLRKKNPKLTQAQAVKQAWAMTYSKKDVSVGATKKNLKTKHSVYLNNADLWVVLTPEGFDALGEGFSTKSEAIKEAKILDKELQIENKVGAVKKKAAKKKSSRYHKDTKSHNVNIRVMSGISSFSSHVFVIRLEKVVKEIAQREEVINSVKSRRKELVEKNGKMWYNKWLRDAKKIVTQLKQEKTKLKSFI